MPSPPPPPQPPAPASAKRGHHRSLTTSATAAAADTYYGTGSSDDDTTLSSSLIGLAMIVIMTVLLMATFPLSLYFSYIIVHDHEKAVIFRNGRLKSVRGSGPGLVFVYPYIDRYCIVDCRTVCYDIPAQKVLTKDSLTVEVDAVVLYRVYNAIIAVTNVRNYRRATELLAATSLRNQLGTKTLTEILAECSLINETLQLTLDTATDFWGVSVERLDIKNVKIPANLQHSLSSEAQAVRESRAKCIQASGEQQASQSLLSAANRLDPMAIQLRFLQTLNIRDSGPGLVFVYPYIDRYCIVDCRTVCYDIPAQKVLTKDSLTVEVDAVVLYRVYNVIIAVTNVRNYRRVN
ncbi:band 7 protein AGAP004871-like [Oppia nitens]|uniref:band 7 protein AGAP004871-like n=1 Tax=Oppia nitens TaxID=1686743 RepID=UPI0023DA78B6|nr:band 7 protein AGAP004871-like [Oppia nitens]